MQCLSIFDAREIRRLNREGVSGVALAKTYDVSSSTIYSILHNETHVDHDGPVVLDPCFPATSFVAGKLLR